MFGLKYVDTPCGKYEVLKGKVYFTDRRLCSLTHLAHLYHEGLFGESKLFQYHKGFFAHLHAMSTDPENTVGKIRNKVVMSILGYSLLALYDNNVFDANPKLNPNMMWVGMIMHTITDSYSPAHTIRDPKASFTLKDSFHDKKGMEPGKLMRLRVHENIKSFAKGISIEYQTRELFVSKLHSMALDDEEFKYITKQSKQLWNMYMIMEFEYETNQVVLKHVKSLKTIRGATDALEHHGDIVAFQYYENQPPLMHSRFDLLRYAKKDMELYQRMKDECRDFLLMYKEVLQTHDVDKFLKNVLKFLVTRPFRVHKNHMKKKTNKVYSPSSITF